MTHSKLSRATAQRPLRILFAASEALPYYKSGGLADVARSLPDALKRRGHDIRIIHPYYDSVRLRRASITDDVDIDVPWLGGTISVRSVIHSPRGRAPGVLLVHPAFAVGTSPYEDNDPHATARRFALFCRTVVHYARMWRPDIVHLNDWQTGLVPVYQLIDDVSIPTVFSIHNLAYQGIFHRRLLDEIGVPQEFFRTENGVEFYNNVSFLKAGLALSSRLTTVSPTYAREIQTHEYGAGFEGLLRFRSHELFGILNGIDQSEWDPSKDAALPQPYDAQSLDVKDELRTAVLRESGMDEDRPLLVVVSRLAQQKGIDIILAALPELLELGVNLFVLGDGDRGIERAFAEVARRFPKRVTAVTAFDDALARRLYSGGDFFLMPSRYEPCGLGQMIAQRYGTPPVVRATGGLRDTVRDGETGFVFEHASVHDVVSGVRRALSVWRGGEWNELRKRCMALDWSWRVSATKYEDVYSHAIGSHGD